MRKRVWPWMLAFGIALHGSIAVLHGLVSFSLIMIGALILYLRPVNRPFHIGMYVRRFVMTLRSHLVGRGREPTSDFGGERVFWGGSNEP